MRHSIVVTLLFFTFACTTLFLPSSAHAADELSELKRELLNLVERVERLEAENRSLREQGTTSVLPTDAQAIAAVKPKEETGPKISGDFRIRHESFDIEGRNSRERTRVRTRVALEAKPAPDLKIGLGLATGGDDPISTNQTLGSGASTKDIRLDLAYFSWDAMPGLTIAGGKLKNHFERPGGNGLMWDGDYRPEGIAVSFDQSGVFVNGALHFMESDTGRSNHRLAYGVQTGYSTEVGGSEVKVGAGYFNLGTEGRHVFYGDPDDFFGNAFSCSPTDPDDCRYLNDYKEIEFFATVSGHLGDQPLSIFADYVRNQDAASLDTGWAIGAKLGKASAPGTWELGYTYQMLEADAVFGLWTDSDFAGGGTDGKGHIIKAGVAINKKWSLKLTYFDNEQGMDLGASNDYRRLQLDSSFKF